MKIEKHSKKMIQMIETEKINATKKLKDIRNSTNI